MPMLPSDIVLLALFIMAVMDGAFQPEISKEEAEVLGEFFQVDPSLFGE